jgi:predicted nucleotidyltransferase
MNLEQIESKKIFEVIGGSHAYGTNTPDSDVDLRGIFVLPPEAHVSIIQAPKQVNDELNDITFYELKRYIELASDCNPNIIELLWTPQDCIKKVTPAMQLLIDNRDMFISKKAYHTFSGYAHSQIKRAKGRNKWVNNPKPKNPPEKLDFCWYIDVAHVGEVLSGQRPPYTPETMPFRPVSIMDTAVGLEDMRCAKMEHMAHTYRLYHDGNGVFKNGEVRVESIPKEDEWASFAGLLIFNEPAYKSAYGDWKNYHEWLKNRNEARYRTMEAGEIDYDAKNVMHCMRLLWSGEHILNHGTPIVRFEGEQRQYLLDIRNGKFEYDEIMEVVEAKKALLDTLKETSTIQNKVNLKKIDELYQEVLALAVKDQKESFGEWMTRHSMK